MWPAGGCRTLANRDSAEYCRRMWEGAEGCRPGRSPTGVHSFRVASCYSFHADQHRKRWQQQWLHVNGSMKADLLAQNPRCWVCVWWQAFLRRPWVNRKIYESHFESRAPSCTARLIPKIDNNIGVVELSPSCQGKQSNWKVHPA